MARSQFTRANNLHSVVPKRIAGLCVARQPINAIYITQSTTHISIDASTKSTHLISKMALTIVLNHYCLTATVFSTVAVKR